MHNGININLQNVIIFIHIIVTYLIINFYGVKLLASVNNSITVFKMFLPAAIVIIFIVYAFMQAVSHEYLISKGGLGRTRTLHPLYYK